MNEKFFALPEEKQRAILNAGYRVFANNSYKKSPMSEIASEAGILYEPKIVDHLVAMVAKYPVGTTVKTNDETEGVVVSQTLDPENPIIMVINAENERHRRNLMLEENISILQIV